MKFDDERERLLKELAKFPALEALIEDSENSEEQFPEESKVERVILPYGGLSGRKDQPWKMSHLPTISR